LEEDMGKDNIILKGKKEGVVKFEITETQQRLR
jgi:hypothetical protein